MPRQEGVACKKAEGSGSPESSLGYCAWHPDFVAVCGCVCLCVCVQVCFDTLTLTMMYVLRGPLCVRVCECA